MKQTPNFQLKQPDYEDFADIEVLNENFEIIDREIQEAKNAATDVGSVELPELNTDNKELTGAINEINTKVTRHLAQYDEHEMDYVKHPIFCTATNIGNDYSVTIPKSDTILSDGMGVVVVIPSNATDFTTLNINGKGAKNITDAGGGRVKNLRAGGVYTLRYNATTSNFIVQGEGGDITIEGSTSLAASVQSFEVRGLPFRPRIAQVKYSASNTQVYIDPNEFPNAAPVNGGNTTSAYINLYDDGFYFFRQGTVSGTMHWIVVK